ncbi:unnamed protein product [Rotaria sp. Silwood1]|nr:unnamed protein product [Rotaria sp. Silwood1]
MSTEHIHRLSTSSTSSISSMSIDDIHILSISPASSISTTMSIDDIQILSTSPVSSTTTSSNTNVSTFSSSSNTNVSSSSSSNSLSYSSERICYLLKHEKQQYDIVDNNKSSSKILKRFIGSILKHQRSINNSPAFSDEILCHLFSSNPSSLATVKAVRDQYERLIEEKSSMYDRLFLQQSRTCELIKELCDAKDKENLENKRKLMFYQGTLHSRGLMEVFRGYLQSVIQPNSTTPMSIKKLYKKMIDMTINSSKSNSIITCIVHDMFQCMKIDWNNLSNDEKMNKSNQLIQKLDNLYSLLSESIHAMKKSRHDQEFIICSNNLNDNQICLIKCIAIHFLRLDHNSIHIEKY